MLRGRRAEPRRHLRQRRQPPGPTEAEGWDDWGPFYTQTYISLLGLDGSTVEMCSSTSLTGGCGGEGRLGSKKAQYVVFYSSMDYWIDNRAQMMSDQVEIYRRGVTDANRPACCADPLVAARGFTEAEHNWMVPYPRAYIIPFETASQRSTPRPTASSSGSSTTGSR